MLKLIDRLMRFSGNQQDVAQIVVRLHKFRIAVDGVLIVDDRIGRIANFELCVAEIEMRLCKRRS